MKRFFGNFGSNLIASTRNAGYGCLLLLEAIYWLKAFFSKFREILRQMYIVGFQSLPVTLIVGIFVGFVLALQTGLSLKTFGMEHLVAQIAGISMTREMGPLMTAIILAGRSGSAFAAEIGTMKVNEEIDALSTMGLDPVRFLAVTRVLAGTFVTPLLTVFANLFGILGGLVVMLSMGYPAVTYVNRVVESVNYIDLLGGLAKAVAFGFLVAGVGCMRGLQTKTGPQAVGVSTTNAVVSGIVLIIVADGIFSVMYYYLGI